MTRQIRIPQSLWLLPIFTIFSLALNFHFLSVPIISDEGGYAYVAKFWTNDYRLYQNIIFDRPQGILLLYKFFLLFTDSIVGFRIFATIAQTLNAFLIYKLASLFLKDKKSSIASAFLYLLFAVSPRIEGFTANAEIFALPLILFSAYLTLKGHTSIATVFSGLAFIVKPIGLSALLFTLIHTSFRNKLSRSGLSKITQNLLIFGLTLLPFLLHIFWTSGEPGNYLWIFLNKSQTDSIFSLNPQRITAFVSNTIATSPAWLSLLSLTLLSWKQLQSSARRFFLIFSLTSFFGLMMGGNWFYHYYVQLMPSLAIFSGLGLFSLISNLKNNQKLLSTLFALVFLCFSLVDLMSFYRLTPYEISWQIYNRLAYTMEKPLVQYISQNTKPDDSIYIAYSDPQLYYLTNRRASHSHLYWTHFTNSPRIREELTAHFNSKKPKLILENFSPQIKYQFPDIDQAISDNYRFKESLQADLSTNTPLTLGPSQTQSQPCDHTYYKTNDGFRLCVNIYERI